MHPPHIKIFLRSKIQISCKLYLNKKTASGFNLQKSTTPLYLPASQTDNQNQLSQSFTIKNIDHLLFSPKTKVGVQTLNKPGYSNKKDSK
jgi:hypothetical protein